MLVLYNRTNFQVTGGHMMLGRPPSSLGSPPGNLPHPYCSHSMGGPVDPLPCHTQSLGSLIPHPGHVCHIVSPLHRQSGSPQHAAHSPLTATHSLAMQTSWLSSFTQRAVQAPQPPPAALPPGAKARNGSQTREGKPKDQGIHGKWGAGEVVVRQELTLCRGTCSLGAASWTSLLYNVVYY